MGPRYSVLIPSKNGMPYLQFAVNSVLKESFLGFELVVSVEAHDVEAINFLSEIEDSRLRVLHPPSGLSMTEHWDWIQLAAGGEWQMFLGQDDGLQSQFFNKAEELSSVAEILGLRTIASKRAYLHWPGSYFDSNGNGSFQRTSRFRIRLESFDKATMSALVGFRHYFDLPQMYTTALFHASLMEECRLACDGKLFTCHPQDANLAALANAFEPQYLYSETPLGWVGSSTKSAGMAIYAASETKTVDGQDDSTLAREYIESIDRSPLTYPKWAGDFSLGSPRVYFWQALLMTRGMQDPTLIANITRPAFLVCLFAASALDAPKDGRIEFVKKLKEIAELNGVKLGWTHKLLTVFFRVTAFTIRVLRFSSAVMHTFFGQINPWHSTQIIRGEAGESLGEYFRAGIVPIASTGKASRTWQASVGLAAALRGRS